MAQATVTALSGQVIVIDLAGVPRLLVVGDRVQPGETVRAAPGASVQLQPDVGAPVALADGQAWLVGAEAPVAADPQLTAAINAVIEVLERGGDLDELEAAAAGVGGGGGGDGSSFVRLLRVSEGVTPLAYEYGVELPGRIDVLEGGAVIGAQAVPVPGEPPEEPEPEPEPEPDKVPVADDDDGTASVIITQDVKFEFNGEWRVMGAGEGSASFEGRLAQEKNQGLWLLSDASFKDGVVGQLQGKFTITDQGQGSDPAFVVTPNFQAFAGQAFDFTASKDLSPADKKGDADRFTAEVFRFHNGQWSLVGAITPGSDGSYSHTFAQDGEYRVKFTVDDETSGQHRASATIDVASDHFFTTITPLPDKVAASPATGNIFDNDTLGDGDWDQHSWAFDGGVPDPVTGNVTVTGTYGTLVVAPDGSYTYRPAPGLKVGGEESFNYTLTDADGDADSATLTVTVQVTVNEWGGAVGVAMLSEADLLGGDGAPAAMAAYAMDDASLFGLQAYSGGSEVEALQKLLNDGSQPKDA